MIALFHVMFYAGRAFSASLSWYAFLLICLLIYNIYEKHSCLRHVFHINPASLVISFCTVLLSRVSNEVSAMLTSCQWETLDLYSMNFADSTLRRMRRRWSQSPKALHNLETDIRKRSALILWAQRKVHLMASAIGSSLRDALPLIFGLLYSLWEPYCEVLSRFRLPSSGRY